MLCDEHFPFLLESKIFFLDPVHHFLDIAALGKNRPGCLCHSLA